MDVDDMMAGVEAVADSAYREGWSAAILALTDELVCDIHAGVPINQERVVTALRVISNRGLTAARPRTS